LGEDESLKKILLTLLKIGISAAILGYLVYDAHRNEAFAHLWRQPKQWGLLTLALVACSSAVVLTLVRWCYLVRALGLPLRMRDALRIGFLGYLFNLAPMGIVGGDLLKGVMLARHQKGKYPESLASVFVDRFVGLYLLFVVASAAILLTGFWHARGAEWVCVVTLVVTGIATAGVVAVLLPDRTQGRSTRWIGRIPYVGRPLLEIVDAVQMYRQRLPVLGAAALMSVGVHSLFTLGVFLIASGLYDRVPALGMHFVLSPLSAAAGILPLPMGPFEFVLDRLYLYAPVVGGGAMTPGQGLVIALGYRIITVLIAAVGICYYLASRAEVAEVLHEAELEAELESEHHETAHALAGESPV
jgi:uncharacterized membrane protein YbhN (UPF0104 family)